MKIVNISVSTLDQLENTNYVLGWKKPDLQEGLYRKKKEKKTNIVYLNTGLPIELKSNEIFWCICIYYDDFDLYFYINYYY